MIEGLDDNTLGTKSHVLNILNAYHRVAKYVPAPSVATISIECNINPEPTWPHQLPSLRRRLWMDTNSVSSVCRWRVQLMERAMRQLNFETVDTLLQVPICHCRCVCHQNNLTRSNRSMIMQGSGAVPVQRQAGRQPLRPAVFYCTLPRMPRMNRFSYITGDTLLRNLFLSSSTLSSLSMYRHG